ncbi:MAG: foldase protein PrsA [Thermodesulfobacteriota bacterium]
MKILFSYLFIILFFSFLGCHYGETKLPDHLVAEVNGEKITVEEFEREMRELLFERGGAGKSSAHRDLRKICLDQMIDRKLLAQEAKRIGLRISLEELNHAFSEIKKDYPGEGLGEKLALKGIALEEWKAGLEEKLLAEKMIRDAQRFYGKIEEEEARKYYESHRSLFQIPQRVRVRQIVVLDGEEALQILKRLKKGESFEKLARDKSIGPEKDRGGDLGFFSKGEMPSEFNRVFSMGVGEISEVIKTPYGYHIFKLEEKIEAQEISFEEAKSSLFKELEREKGEEAFQQWFNGLKEKAKIKINRTWLRS